eukprot:TRINITY_DN3504_c0_g1_i1.p1 TRINITY_DN3504_c0_g1~~TRINITY_DN3504_c0_g1_i1.p1  ORF type:complete len:326 (+),score=86.87 TRINITY_DN3504_c0_g1_i1:128-1105(+)
MSVPTFDLTKPRYDQTTYKGRFLRMINLVNPSTLFITKSELKNYMKLLDDYKNGKIDKNVTDAELWAARNIKESMVHPDTGDIIPRPFRMSGFIPYGTPVVVFMLCATTLPTVIAGQFFNQSHNALFNYFNRNASNNTESNSQFIQSFLLAVTSAIGIGVSLNILINKSTFAPATKAIIQRFTVFPAVAYANICNIFFMRRSELKEGIHIKDKDDNIIGSSKIAAKSAIFETAITRVCLSIPILLFPPICMGLLQKYTSLLTTIPRANVIFQTIFSTIGFAIGLPVTTAFFPQDSKIKIEELEPQFHPLKTDNNPVDYLYYNKGL